MVTRQDFLKGTMFAGVLSACPVCARAADAAAGIAPGKPRPKTPGMEPLSELFRIGYGPSSSHTMGPARASEIFRARHAEAKRFEVTLYGSLSATGKGHFTDRAIEYVLGPDRTKVVWSKEELPFHPNGMQFRAYDAADKELEKWTCFSIGGGALAEEGKMPSVPKVYKQDTMADILAWCGRNGSHFWELFDKTEGKKGWEHLEAVWKQMQATIAEGLKADGVLPGGLNLPRKAKSFYRQALKLAENHGQVAQLAAYAYAVNEENAALGLVVTAPTCGSCGTLPAVLRYMQRAYKCSDRDVLKALATAGLVGNVVKQNGSISGAEAGCQAEVGTACAMAAAAAAYLMGATPAQCEYAAQMSLEHCLGLTCDPAGGLVQIPCIERNAIAANRAITAAEMALLGDGKHLISFDKIVKIMLETGHDLPSIYRETSKGGIAVHFTGGC